MENNVSATTDTNLHPQVQAKLQPAFAILLMDFQYIPKPAQIRLITAVHQMLSFLMLNVDVKVPQQM